MKRILAAIQFGIVILIVGFATWQLYMGNFELALAGFPILIAYYFLLLAFKRRQ